MTALSEIRLRMRSAIASALDPLETLAMDAELTLANASGYGLRKLSS